MMENKVIYVITHFIIKVLNILVIMPLVLAFGIVIVALCVVDIALFIAAILSVLKIFIPNLPVNLGVDNIILKIATVCICVIMGYYLNKFLSMFIPAYLQFLGSYIKCSFTIGG